MQRVQSWPRFSAVVPGRPNGRKRGRPHWGRLSRRNVLCNLRYTGPHPVALAQPSVGGSVRAGAEKHTETKEQSMVAPAESTPTVPTRRNDDAPIRADQAAHGNSARVTKSGSKGASAGNTVKSGLIDLVPADTYWTTKTKPAAGGQTHSASGTLNTPQATAAASQATNTPYASSSTTGDSAPIEKQIDRLNNKLHIPPGADTQKEINDRLGRLLHSKGANSKESHKVIDDKTIDVRIAGLEAQRKGKDRFARRKIDHDIGRLKELKELRRLTTAAASLRQEADRLAHELTGFRGKIVDQTLSRAERNQCSLEAKLRVDRLAAIRTELIGPPEPPKGEAALMASSNRMDDLSYNFAHPPEHFVKAADLRTQLSEMQKEFSTYAGLSREIYGNAQGADEYFAFMRRSLNHALTHLCEAGRMNHIRMNDIDALHREIDQLEPSKPEPANSSRALFVRDRHNTPGRHTPPVHGTPTAATSINRRR